MWDNIIKDLKNKIKGIQGIQRIYNSSSKLLNDIADVYERYGFELVNLFISEKISRANEEGKIQLELIKQIIKILNEYPEIRNNRHIGRYLIKNLKNVIS